MRNVIDLECAKRIADLHAEEEWERFVEGDKVVFL